MGVVMFKQIKVAKNVFLELESTLSGGINILVQESGRCVSEVHIDAKQCYEVLVSIQEHIDQNV